MNGIVKSKRKRTRRAAIALSAALLVGGFGVAPADARPNDGRGIGSVIPPRPRVLYLNQTYWVDCEGSFGIEFPAG